MGCRREAKKLKCLVDVFVVPDNSLFAGPDHEICLGETIPLIASGVGNPLWTPENIVADPTGFSTSAIPDTSGYILLNMTFDECTQYDSLYVEVHTQAEIEAIGDSVCIGEMGKLMADGKADNYQWILDDGSIVSNNEIEVLGEATQTLKVIGEYRTCKPDTAEAILYVYPEIDYRLDNENYIIHLNDEVPIEPSFDINRNYIFEWIPETGLDCVDCADPIISGLMEHTNYSLYVRDEDSGCMSEYQINVRFQNECTQDIFHLPNIFSPDGNGVNDIFSLTTKNPEEFISLSVFDRWGNVLFTSDDINIGWDGKFGSKMVQPGVYVYQLNLICPFTNEEFVILGDISVVY